MEAAPKCNVFNQFTYKYRMNLLNQVLTTQILSTSTLTHINWEIEFEFKWAITRRKKLQRYAISRAESNKIKTLAWIRSETEKNEAKCVIPRSKWNETYLPDPNEAIIETKKKNCEKRIRIGSVTDKGRERRRSR